MAFHPVRLSPATLLLLVTISLLLWAFIGALVSWLLA
jgi:hypothetical protein